MLSRTLKTCFRITIAMLVLWMASVAPGHSAVSAPRAIWIWEEDAFRMLDNDKARQEVETFLDKHHISTMYLYADKFKSRNILVNEPKKYRKLIKSAHKRGFKVFALLGSAYLRTQEYILPEKRAVAIQMFRAVLDFNRDTPDATSRFDGVNIDH